MLEIVQAPNPVLSKEAQVLPGNPPKLDFSFIREMEKALDEASDPKGVGLAAPQVNKSISLFITKPGEKSKLQVFVNPKIISYEDKPKIKGQRSKNNKLEGCLSLKDIWGEVKRHDAVILEYYDENGKKHKKKFSGFMSTIIQHEVDHLHGILFPKRVLEQKRQLYHSKMDEDNEMIFEPIEI